MSESDNQTISIFPPENVNEHLLDKSLPNFLKHRQDITTTTYQEFVKRNQETLSFLERNSIENNPFKIQAESFEFHFQELRQLYSKMCQSPTLSESEEEKSHLLNLLRYERSIHDVCEFSATQDVSIYLNILQKIFDDENSLLELICLMNKKHFRWEHKLSPAYLNWMHFLTPFIQYIRSESNNIESVNFDEKIKNCLNKLDESEVAKELGKKLSDLDPKDHQAIKQEILSFKKNPNIRVLKDYYHVLGICVLLQSLMRFSDNPTTNFGFFRLLVQISIYHNKLYQFEGKGIENIIDTSAFRVDGNFYLPFITNLLSSKIKEHIESQKQTLLDSLYILATKDLCNIKLVESTFLEEIFEFIIENSPQQHDDSQSWLINNYEYLLWSYFSIIKQLFLKSLSSSKEREKLCLIISSKLPALTKPQRIFTLDVYYHLQSLAVQQDSPVFQKNLNFSEIPLQDLIFSSCEQQDLFLNLRYSFGAILKSTKLDSSLRNDIFEEKLQQKEAKNNPNLKYILIFLAKIQTHKLPGDNEETDIEKSSPSLIKLLTLLDDISHQLNIWDLLNLQRVFCSTLSSSNISESESTKKLIKLFVDKITEAQITPKSIFLRSEILIIKDKQTAASNFIIYLMSSIQDIKTSSYDKFWEHPHLKDQLVLNKNRLFNFARSWTENIIEAISLITSEEQKSSITEPLRDFISQLLHPSLNLVCSDSERSSLNKTLLKILESHNDLGLLIQNLQTNLAEATGLIEKSGLEVQELPVLRESSASQLHLSALLQNVQTCAHILQNLKEEKIKQISKQDLDILLKDLSNIFGVVIAYSKANSTELSKFENFLSQNLLKITAVLVKPFLIAKQYTEVLESFFDRFLITTNDLLTYYHIIAFLNLVISIEKLSPGDMIFKFTVQNSKLWSMLVNFLKLFMKNPEDKQRRIFISNKLKDVISNFEKLFRGEVSAYSSKDFLTTQLGYSLPVDQVIRDLIVSLNNEFESFDVYDLLAVNSTDLNASFSGILEIYEKSIYFYGKMNAIVIADIQKAIQANDLALIRYRKAKFGETGYAVEAGCMGSLFGDEEEEEDEFEVEQEITAEETQQQQPRDAEEKRLMDEGENQREKLKIIQKFQIEEIKAKISEKIQEFGIIFPFKTLVETFKPYQKSCLLMILQSLDSLFREVKCDNFQAFLREGSLKELPRIQATDDNNFNQIITLDLYLNLVLKFLAHYNIQDELFKSEQFIWSFYSVVTKLFTNLLSQSPIIEELEELNFTQLFQNIFDTLVSYFTYKSHHLKEKLTSDQSLNLLQWVQLFFKTCSSIPSFTIPTETLLLKAVNLIQIALKSDPQTSCAFLISHPEILKAILSTSSSQIQPWSLDLTKEISFVFSIFLQSSLPNEKGVVLKLNQLLTKSGFSLRTFANNPIVQQQEVISPQNLVSIIEHNYQVTLCPTAKGQSEFTPDHILIRFDPTKITKNLEETVSDIISNMSTLSKNIIDVLIFSLVQNYCENLSIILSEGSELKSINFKETSSIFTILTTLFQNYPQALVYAALHKADYSNVIPNNKKLFPHSDKVKSLTFFECLFEINYFSLNDTEMSSLVKVLYSLNSGVLFRENNETKDICEVLVYDFLSLVNKNLQQRASEITTESSWKTLEKSLFIFTATWVTYEVQRYSVFTETWKAFIRKELKSLFNTLLENLLSEIGFLVKNYYSLTNSWSHLDNFLLNLAQKHFNQIIQDLKLPVESFDALKVDHYISFLQSASQESHPFSLKLLQKQLDIEQPLSTVQEHYSPQYIQNDTITLPYEESIYIYASEAWKSKVNIFGRNLKSDDSLVKNFTLYKTKTAFPISGQRDYSSQIPDCKIPQWQISGQSAFVDLTLKIHEILNKKLQIGVAQSAENSQPVVAPTTVVEGIASNPVQSTTTTTSLDYFKHPTLQDLAEFVSIKSRVIMLLKETTERVLISQLKTSDSKAETEIKSSLKNLTTEFESNLFLGLLEQFEVLKPHALNFKNLAEIQQELAWIEGNFDSYLKILRGNGEIPQTQSQPQDNSLLPMTNNATFCTTASASSNPLAKKAHPIKSQKLDEQYDALKEFDFSDDKIIESLQAFFFVKYSSDNIYSTNTNMMSVIEYLCNSPKFEIKLFDLLLFILYCPESIRNPDFPILINGTSEETFTTVATHILRFFQNYLPKKPAVIYQPRIFLELYGFKSLEKLKANHKPYQQQIASTISILDLIIGLLEIPDLNQEHQKLIFSFVNVLLQKNDALQIVEPQHLKENQETLRVLTTASCNLMAKHEALQPVLFQLPDFVLYNWKNVIQTKFEDQLDLMYHPVKDLNFRIKVILKRAPGEPTAPAILDELKFIESAQQIQQKFEEMEKRLDLANFILIKILLRKKEFSASTSDQSTDHSQKALKSIEQILADPLVQEFFTHLFELASYLLDAGIDADQSAKKLRLDVLLLCIHFYSLLCIKEMAHGLEKAAKAEESAGMFPNLPSLVSKESIDELKHVPELENTFSHIIRENKFDFDILFANLCKKYQTVIASQVFVKPNLKKQFTIICRRIPWCIDFITKKRILADNIAKSFRDQGISTSQRNIYIEREAFLKTTFKAFLQQTKHDLGRPIRINYVDEQGYDAGGLTRDFFTNIAGELFDSRVGLFQLSPNQTNIQPGFTAKIIDGHLKYMELAGIILAKAIQQDCTMDLNFTKSFLKQILRRRILLDDLEDYDSDLAKNLKWMLSNSVEGLEQPFTFESQIFDENTTIELIPNGYDVVVDDENKNDFVAKVCEMKMHRQISDEIASFLKGFYHVMPVDALDIFSASEFQILIAGIPIIDVEEMKKSAIFSHFTIEVEYLKGWLWEILLEFSQKELAAFLFFISGSLKPPGGGFAEKPVRFRYMGENPLRLPIAHTCSWEIEIAKYASREDFKHKLLIAIFDGQGSFMIS